MGAPLWLSNVAQVTSGLSHFKDTLEVLKEFKFEGTENNLQYIKKLRYK